MEPSIKLSEIWQLAVDRAPYRQKQNLDYRMVFKLFPKQDRNLDDDPSMPAKSEDDGIVAEIKSAILSKIILVAGKDVKHANIYDWYIAAALTLRDRIVYQWLQSDRSAQSNGDKRVYYLSLEFLIGRLLTDALTNMSLVEPFRTAIEDLGIDFDELRDVEPDAALGNGGLGRLAACFMESMATLAIPAQGYGIRYEHGLFRQIVSNGWQEEFPEQWLLSGNPWEFERSDVIFDIQYGGRLDRIEQPGKPTHTLWIPDETIQAVAYDTPIVGWRGRHVNALRLWSARAVDPMRLDTFNSGDHLGAGGIDADNFGGVDAFPECAKPVAQRALPDPDENACNGDERHQDDVVIGQRTFELKHQQAVRCEWHRETSGAPRHRCPRTCEHAQHLAKSERCQCEIVPAEFHGREAENIGGKSADRGARQHSNPGRDAEIDQQQRGRIGSESEEGGMAKGYLVGEAADDIPCLSQRGKQQGERNDPDRIA